MADFAGRGHELDELDVQAKQALEDETTDAQDAWTGVLAKWDAKRPTEPFLDLLETVRGYDVTGALDDLLHARALQGLDVLDDDELAEIKAAEGWIATTCPDAGDGHRHDSPNARPYISGTTWDPHTGAWNAESSRTSTARDRWMGLANAAAKRDQTLGWLELELTLPPELVPRAWAEIAGQDGDGGNAFAQMGTEVLKRLWDAWDLPGEPVGTMVCIHRTSSSKPWQIRPHLHVMAPALYRDEHGVLRFLEREPGGHAPLQRPRADLDQLREIWATVLEDAWDHRRDEPENANYGYGWLISREDETKLRHALAYRTRETPLEDLRDRLTHVGPQVTRVDVSDVPDIDRDELTAKTRDVVGGWLTVRGLTPDRWQMARWHGELSHRTWRALAEEIRVPDLDPDTENTWGHLEQIGRRWANGHEDRRALLLQSTRAEIAADVEALAFDALGIDRPPPEVHRAVEIWSWEAVVWVTHPQRELCDGCGQVLETHRATTDDILDYVDQIEPDVELAINAPDPHDRPPEQKSPTQRRWDILNTADARDLAHQRHQTKRARLGFGDHDLDDIHA